MFGQFYVVSLDVYSVDVVEGVGFSHVVVVDFHPFRGYEELSVSAGRVEDGFSWGEVVEVEVGEDFYNERGWCEDFSGCLYAFDCSFDSGHVVMFVEFFCDAV